MNKWAVIGSLLTLLLTTPIWFYLLYRVLVLVQADSVMWLLFWVYVPVSFLAHLILKIAEA